MTRRDDIPRRLLINEGDTIPRLPFCPDCDGRGWFLINPFAMGGTNGAGGLSNMYKCQTCVDALAYYEEFGELPAHLAEAYEQYLCGNE